MQHPLLPLGRRFATWWAVLFAMVIALLCALVPVGPASGRAAGSAFDPTTSSVALHSKFQPMRDAGEHVDESDGHGGAQVDRPDVPLGAVLLLQTSCAGACRDAFGEAVPNRGSEVSVLSGFGARAPPTA